VIVKTRILIVLALFTVLAVFGLAAPATRTGSARSAGTSARLARSARTPKFTSAYTSLRTQCRSVGTAGQGDDPSQRCTGVGGYVIVVDFSAASSHLRIEPSRNPTESNTVQLGEQPIDFDKGGKKVEWRLADGKPFAVIIRMEKHKDVDDPTAYWQPQNRLGQMLLVQGLGEHRGVNAEVDAAKPTANADARKLADDAYQIPD
jgi:hypothetical protein